MIQINQEPFGKVHFSTLHLTLSKPCCNDAQPAIFVNSVYLGWILLLFNRYKFFFRCRCLLYLFTTLWSNEYEFFMRDMCGTSTHGREQESHRTEVFAHKTFANRFTCSVVDMFIYEDALCYVNAHRLLLLENCNIASCTFIVCYVSLSFSLSPFESVFGRCGIMTNANAMLSYSMQCDRFNLLDFRWLFFHIDANSCVYVQKENVKKVREEAKRREKK